MARLKIIITDVITFTLYIAVIILSLLFIPRKGNSLKVKAENKEYIFSLENDGIYSVDGTIGETEFEIKDGKARIINSPCPNKTCVSSGWSTTLVCLPNKVIATIEDAEGDLDVVAR